MTDLLRQLTLDIRLPAEPTFANFVPGPNAEALQMAQAVGDNAPPAPGLLFWGPPGSGKSHLLQAIAAARADHQWLDPARLASITPPADAAVLLADDLDRWPDDALAEFFLLLNLVRPRDDVVVVTTAAQPPAGLSMRDDVRTRLAAGLVIGLQLLSDADKRIALQSWAGDHGHHDIEAVAQWLLLHRDRDIRSLVAYLDALDQYALLTRRPLSVRLIHDFENNRRSGDA